ncbi:hypothetical protein [Coralloluteibacterium thermophilus]|uniref:Uncharacterized protein n=1 Tax=Coralloluteibacterium thermophilum TaxID=2707049 RepID=A0ABV9NFJ8_9GAMM
MRQVVLSSQKAGITRLRGKGGASAEALWDLRNAYVTSARTIKRRPGMRRHIDLPPGTVGLAAFEGVFVVFASSPVENSDPRVRVEVLRHPSREGAELRKIHFAAPFYGALYVAAEFDQGEVFHYWLSEGVAWTPQTVKMAGDRVEPTVQNGFSYVATRAGDPRIAWAPGVPRAVGDVVEPTVQNGFEYVVVDVIGSAPASGAVEPVWPTEEGAQVIEDTDAGGGSAPTPPAPAPPPTPYPPGYGGGRSNNDIPQQAR